MPPNLRRNGISSAAPLLDLAYLLARRAAWSPAVDLLRERRNQAVSRRAVRRIHRNASRVQGVITTASACIQVARVCRELGIPLITYLPQPYDDGDPAYREEVDLADGLLVASEYVASSTRQMATPKPVVVSNLGFEHPADLPKPEVRNLTGSEALRLIFVGRDDPNKGLGYLTTAVESLNRRGSHVHLTVVSPDAGAIGAKVRDMKEVTVVGPMPRNELYRRFDHHHALVVPSVREGFGLVVVEALSRRLPVIATSTTGAADMGFDGVAGIVVPPSDSSALEQAIEKIADGERLACFSDSAYSIAALYSWESYAHRTAEGVRDLFTAIRARKDSKQSS